MLTTHKLRWAQLGENIVSYFLETDDYEVWIRNGRVLYITDKHSGRLVHYDDKLPNGETAKDSAAEWLAQHD